MLIFQSLKNLALNKKQLTTILIIYIVIIKNLQIQMKMKYKK